MKGWISVLVLAGLLGVGGTAAAEPLAESLKSAGRDAVYRGSPAQELVLAEDLFARTLAGCPQDSAGAWDALGWRSRQIELAGSSYLLLEEAPGERRGRGLFLLRCGPGPALVLQAPHRHFDLDSGELVHRLAAEGRPAAVAWNSLHRREGDLARTPHSYFTALALAFARQYPQGRVVQLHGFARGKRTSPAGRSADLIVSAGSREPGPGFERTGRCLQAAIPGAVRLFPAEVQELGGTTNAVGRRLREVGFPGFLHLEFSGRTRRHLLDDGSARAALLQCLMPEDR